MAYTTKKLVAKNPSVEWTSHFDGSLTAVLTFYREKRGGALEEFTVRFLDLSVDEAACIGSRARVAVHQARGKVKERMDKAYNRIITPGS